ncbi:MAG: 5-(carboxyamino)imidazole ribonucleotide synthase [Firmicutes bacterium]|nr:5-(carboxyamino)imidazole ribonucleotide synthase [Dethiobacter sp.]MBS3888974.1 5-(carboxyamino)imidazole ribonucleotide synthase [Bacillota bacterium]MBS4055487.1 5-(carboxyamino)imidazole ribonucleotide synthase [Thermaerobacter sp.]
MSKLPLRPGSVIGILGGGQLGRMTAMAAKAMGYKVLCLDPTPNSPCGQVCDGQVVGSLGDREAAFHLARQSDIVIYEFENIDAAVVRALEGEHCVPQGSNILAITQNRILEKAHLAAHGVPLAPYRVVRSAADLSHAVAELGLPLVLKSALGGYDGKGQLVLRGSAEVEAALAQVARGGEFVVEKFVELHQEVSVIIARRPGGESALFPIAENRHCQNVLHTTIVPARLSQDASQQALELATSIAHSLDLVGILAVEMFVTPQGLLVNELAPRPHNSGHFSFGACYTSQFEQFVRAVADLPLGGTDLLFPAVMFNILGRHQRQVYANWPLLQQKGKVHLYGKSSNADAGDGSFCNAADSLVVEAHSLRKMGHILLRSSDPEPEIAWLSGLLEK